jgi:uncharacterized protein
MRRWPANLLVLIVRGYQRFISPILGPCCRSHPTCSQYAIEALQTHAALKGSRLFFRLFKQIKRAQRLSVPIRGIT